MKKVVYIFEFLIWKKCTSEISINMPDCVDFIYITIIGYITMLYSMKQSGIYDRLLNRMPGTAACLAAWHIWNGKHGVRRTECGCFRLYDRGR